MTIISLNEILLIEDVLFPVHGNWGPWSNWGTCSRTCNSGLMRRYRTCDNPYPFNGGRACAGADTQIQRCHTELCPGELSGYVRGYVTCLI